MISLQFWGLILNFVGAVILFFGFLNFNWKEGRLYGAEGNIGRAIFIARILGLLLLIMGFLLKILALYKTEYL